MGGLVTLHCSWSCSCSCSLPGLALALSPAIVVIHRLASPPERQKQDATWSLVSVESFSLLSPNFGSCPQLGCRNCLLRLLYCATQSNFGGGILVKFANGPCNTQPYQSLMASLMKSLNSTRQRWLAPFLTVEKPPASRPSTAERHARETLA